MSTQNAHPLNDPQVDPFEIASQAATQIAERTGVASHDIALTLGSGWAKAADLIGVTTATIPASEIIGFSAPLSIQPPISPAPSPIAPCSMRTMAISSRT